MKRLFLILALFSATAFAEPTFQQIEGLIEQKQYQAAESGLEQIIQNHPNSAKAFYAMSQAQAGLGHLDKAQFALNKARGLDPELKFASASNIESLQQAITPQTANIEVVTESHVLRNIALFLLVVAGGYFIYTVYARKQEEEEAALKAEEEARAERKARVQRLEARAAQARAEVEAEEAKEAALRAHKNYGHERFDPANPDKLKTVKQMKEEKAAQELREAQARAERAELDARLARSNAASGPAYAQPTHTTVVNNSNNDMLTTMVALDMLSNHNHDSTRVVEREVIREVPAPTRDTSWDTPAPTPSRSSTWDDTPSTPSRSSSWDDSSSSSSSSSWGSSGSDSSSSSWGSSDSSSSSSSDW